MKPIDGDVLRELFDANTWQGDMMRSAIDSMPEIDPVRHGYWIENQPYTIKHKNVTMSGKAPQCSECGHISFEGFKNKTRYCPNCGAKMDKEALK